MFDESTYPEEKANTLSDKDLLKVLDSILDFEKKWNCSMPSFAITGGDPLQRKNWFEFFSVLRENDKAVNLMGNPETLTAENLKLLRELGVKRFQMSLDGLESTHDYFRSEGSFKRTINKIAELEDHGITSEIMFTLYPENKNELFSLIKYLAGKTPLSYFRFDIGTTTGNANALSRDLHSQELRVILERYLAEKEILKNKRHKLLLVEKIHLFSLLHYNNNSISKIYNSVPVAGGCPAGWYSIAILSDGTVLSCRRLPFSVGKMPEQSFEEIFLGSEFLKKLRRRSYFTECGSCILYQNCRGCPAYVQGITGDPFKSYPLCFKDINESNTDAALFPEPGLGTTYEEEYKFISSAFWLNFDYLIKNLWEDNKFRELYLRLQENEVEKKAFLNDKNFYLQDNNIVLSDWGANTLQCYFGEYAESGLMNKDFMDKFIYKLKIRHINN
jgi:radical SAM protein with 4Fe4S-binding SPASM domain